jgi:hypothetical protein
MPCVAKSQLADDPKVASLLTDDFPAVVDQTAPIAGEQTSGRDGVKSTPRVDLVAQHLNRIDVQDRLRLVELEQSGEIG